MGLRDFLPASLIVRINIGDYKGLGTRAAYRDTVKHGKENMGIPLECFFLKKEKS